MLETIMYGALAGALLATSFASALVGEAWGAMVCALLGSYALLVEAPKWYRRSLPKGGDHA